MNMLIGSLSQIQQSIVATIYELRSRWKFWSLLSLKIWAVTYVLDVLMWLPTHFWGIGRVLYPAYTTNKVFVVKNHMVQEVDPDFIDHVLYSLYDSLFVWPVLDARFESIYTTVIKIILCVIASTLIVNVIAAVRKRPLPKFFSIEMLKKAIQLVAICIVMFCMINVCLIGMSNLLTMVNYDFPNYTGLIRRFFVICFTCNLFGIVVFKYCDELRYFFVTLYQSLKIIFLNSICICFNTLLFHGLILVMRYQYDVKYEYVKLLRGNMQWYLVGKSLVWMSFLKFIILPFCLLLVFNVYAQIVPVAEK